MCPPVCIAGTPSPEHFRNSPLDKKLPEIKVAHFPPMIAYDMDMFSSQAVFAQLPSSRESQHSLDFFSGYKQPLLAP